MDITPDYPIRLSGYGGRRTVSEGVAQKLWAKALAIGSDQDKPVLWISVDNCGLSADISNDVAKRLLAKASIPRERIAICSTHTHSGPCVTGVLPNLFSQDIIPEEQATIDRYTKELIDQLEQLALAALADRRPANLSWGQGEVDFAQNRRTPKGPVDHTLSLLRVSDPNGKVRALLLNYACHCTTLGGEFNKLHGDWAGCAQEAVEKEFPGSIALVAIACGGDSNPFPRGKVSDAVQHGDEISAEIKRMLKRTLIVLNSPISCRSKQIDLPFEDHPTREQWEKRAQQKGIVGYHARKNLARLDRGEKLPASIPYFIQSWNFGNEVVLVFLGGEVVIDYQLRLKKEFDATRLWVTAYANDVPCYIPSRRVLAEGGYEPEESLWYYDRPARFRPEVEERIIAAAHEIMPKEFLFDAKKAEFPPPKSPSEALASFRTKGDLAVDLVASEPLIFSPVAIDFSPDGKLWVCEMFDYPSGLDGKGKPGGRIKFLEDLDGDGFYEKATVFIDGIPFPTGVMAWRKGALICAAPDILYAEDTNGDGKADEVKKLYSGFATHNFQARVNGLSWGLDGWVYGAAGLFGGKILSSITGNETELSGRDFRIQPDTGEFEPVNGLSQHGRVRDDFDNWFGCDNSTLIWHFPMPEYYLRRNPHVAAPEPRVYPVRESDPNHLFPASRTLERFNEPQAANRTTSACGLEIYRDEFLGSEYAGNAFVCEPVHNLVHRLKLKRDGVTFIANRAEDEQHSEFLASTDNWFRPVQARTGPDGALWIVDMYRFVIEHPRWIPAERLAKLDVRAGEDKGRIYRVLPLALAQSNARPARLPNVRAMSSSELVQALASPNGPLRDLAHREIMERKDRSQVSKIFQSATNNPNAGARVQALAALHELKQLTEEAVATAFIDKDPRVRQYALRVSESLLWRSEGLADRVVNLANDPDEAVRFQLALSLGEWHDDRAGKLLGKVAAQKPGSWMQAAILSSAAEHAATIAQTLLKAGADTAGPLLSGLIATTIGGNRSAEFARIWSELQAASPALRFAAVDAVVKGLQRKNIPLDRFFSVAGESRQSFMRTIEVEAPAVAQDASASETLRVQAIVLLAKNEKPGLLLLSNLCHASSPVIAQAAIDSTVRTGDSSAPEILLAGWDSYVPAARAAVLNALLTRAQWVQPVLDAISAGRIAPVEVPLGSRERLLKNKNPEIAARARHMFGGEPSSDRAQVLEHFKAAANLTGDRVKGGEVFEKLCSTCHALNRKGYAVGPDLASLRDKPADYLLLAILDPNAVVEPKFVSYEIETRSGRSLTGVIQSETGNGLTLVQAGGIKEQLLRSDLEQIKASSRSLMPEGLEQGTTPQDFADLIAYLKSSGPARFGSATAQQAAVARGDFLKGGGMAPSKVLFASENLSYGGWLGRVQMPNCRQTDGKSRLAWEMKPSVAPGKTNGTVSFRLPVAMGFISQPKGDFKLKINGQDVLSFDVSLTDNEWESSDHKVRLRYTVMETNAEDSNGPLEIEVASSMIELGRPVEFEVVASAANSQRWFGVYMVER